MGLIVEENFVQKLITRVTSWNGKVYSWRNETEMASEDYIANGETLAGIQSYIDHLLKNYQSKVAIDGDIEEIKRLYTDKDGRSFSPNLQRHLRIKTGERTKIGGITLEVVRGLQKLLDISHQGEIAVENDFSKKSRHSITASKDIHKKSNGQAITYDEYCQSALTPNAVTYKFEDALILLIERFKRPHLKKVTIVADSLSYLNRILPTICDFLAKGGIRGSLLFGPRNGYSLLREPELLLLYKLGFEIEILDVKDTFDYHGFIFDYFAPTDSRKFTDVEFFRIRNNTFDYGPLMDIWRGSDNESLIKLRRALRVIQDKRTKSFVLSKGMPFVPRFIPETEYTDWLYKRFSIWQSDRNSIHAPLYSILIQREKFTDIKFQFETIDFANIYFRGEYLLAYKVRQAEKLFKDHHIKDDGSIKFLPTNLFDNDTIGFYPINVPILEFNQTKNRYEAAEGMDGLFYLALKKLEVKKIRTVIVYGLPDRAFHVKEKYKEKENTIIRNDWKNIPIRIDTYPRESIYTYTRDIENVTHVFSRSSYVEIAQKLIDANILSLEEAKYFLGTYRSRFLDHL